MLSSTLWQGIGRICAIRTILVGAITVVVWKQMTGGIFELYEIVPGFIFAMLVGVIVSKISPPTDKTIADFSAFRESLKTQ